MPVRVRHSSALDAEALSRSMTPSPSEDPLLAGIRLGTPDIGAIYLAYHELMYRVARRACGPDEHALGGVTPADIVATVMERTQVHGIPPDTESVRAYLARAVRNAVVDARRRVSRRSADEYGPTLTRLEYGVEPNEVEAIQRYRQPSPEEIALEREQLEHEDRLIQRAHALLPTLTPNQHRVFEECVLKARRPADVAPELNVTPQRVSQLRIEALRRLVREMGELESHHG